MILYTKSYNPWYTYIIAEVVGPAPYTFERKHSQIHANIQRVLTDHSEIYVTHQRTFLPSVLS